ncbi:MerR family transcriptional regulator [Streptomyces griseus]|uniref:MerR family transcriptional regulator n=1 Tax=Streptomyces griseus TaxID=1911 RepID=UPI0037A88479
MRDLYSISEVAEAFGLTVATLRFYEERGLVRHSERRGRVRYYRRADLAQLAYAQLSGTRTACSRSRRRAPSWTATGWATGWP